MKKIKSITPINSKLNTLLLENSDNNNIITLFGKYANSIHEIDPNRYPEIVDDLLIPNLFYLAIKYNNKELLKSFFPNPPKRIAQFIALGVAIESNNSDILKFLLDEGFKLSDNNN